MKQQSLEQALTSEQGERLVSTARVAARALAEYWDALREIEEAHGVTLEGMVDVISSLAGDCSIPPLLGDLQHVTVSELLGMMEVTAGA